MRSATTIKPCSQMATLTVKKGNDRPRNRTPETENQSEPRLAIVPPNAERHTTQTMSASSIQPPHELQTKRLTLRSARTGDGLALHEAIGVSLKEFYPWLSFSSQLSDVETLERVSQIGEREFQKGESYVWRAWETNGVLVGSVDLHSINRTVPSCEIGYWLRSDRTGEGLAQEFVTAAVDIAHETLKVERIEARCDVRNERAWRLVERLGFAFEGIARNEDRDAAGELCSSKVYALVRSAAQ